MKVILSLFCLLIIQSAINAAPNIARPIVNSDVKAGNDAVVVSENSKPRQQQQVPKLVNQKVLSVDEQTPAVTDLKKLEPKQSQTLDLDQTKVGSQQQIQSEAQQNVIPRQSEPELIKADDQKKIDSENIKVKDAVPVISPSEDQKKVEPKDEKKEEPKKVDQRIDSGLDIKPEEVVKPISSDIEPKMFIKDLKTEDKKVETEPKKDQKEDQELPKQVEPVLDQKKDEKVIEAQKASEEKVVDPKGELEQKPDVKKPDVELKADPKKPEEVKSKGEQKPIEESEQKKVDPKVSQIDAKPIDNQKKKMDAKQSEKKADQKQQPL